MLIIPAIDIKNGQVVRLLRGQFDQVTVYADDPVTIAQKWENEGAERLHVVDLDGAQTGSMKNIDLILKIAHSVHIPIEVGGGIRNQDTVNKLLTNGVSFVVLGTTALKDRSFLKNVLARWKEKIIVSVDCSQGKVTHSGWVTTSEREGDEFAQELAGFGVPCLIYTDIKRDGTLQGPNIKTLKQLLKVIKIPVIASGGISTIKDLEMLAGLTSQGLLGAITGKAIYEGRINLKEAIRLCSPKG
jgi:phosphoribosylformimino-5-aminoimidazole carboxamide ribotide isomerase